MTGAPDEEPGRVNYRELPGVVCRAANLFAGLGGPHPSLDHCHSLDYAGCYDISALQPLGKTMFKHLLLPTDGSDFSAAAVQKGLRLASSLGARVTFFNAIPEYQTVSHQSVLADDSRDRFAKDCQTQGDQVLAEAAQAAQAAGVACDTVSAISDHPFEVIVKVAVEKGCDLIVMASHGRKGLRGFLLGSETQKVLTHSTIPVLVYR